MLTAPVATRNTNPVDVQRNFEELAIRNPKKAAKLGTELRTRLENVLIEAENATIVALELIIIGLSNLGLSIMDGSQEWHRLAMQSAWRRPDLVTETEGRLAEVAAKANEYVTGQNLSPGSAEANQALAQTSPFREGDFRDPTLLAGVPILVWITGGLGIITFLARRAQLAYIGTSLTLGALTALTGSLGRDIGMRMAERRAMGAAEGQ